MVDQASFAAPPGPALSLTHRPGSLPLHPAAPPPAVPLSAHAGARLPTVDILRDRQSILAMEGTLRRLAVLCGQTGMADDLAYFLSTPDALRKRPCLILSRALPGESGVDGYKDAVLLFEYRVPAGRLGGGTGVFATADSTGRRNVLAPAGVRARTTARAARALLASGAHIVHIAHQPAADVLHLRSTGIATATELSASVGRTGGDPQLGRRLWSLREEHIPAFLPLAATFDETLARIGQRTRSNLRYYRRRTERDLGCGFVARIEPAQLPLADFLAFNRECMYAVSAKSAVWRHEALGLVRDPLLAGIVDRDGRWLSIVGGRRGADGVEIDWQMNRDGLPHYSLSTVLRACLIEDEVSRGSRRLYIEGGTPQPIGRSFAEEPVAQLTVKRQTPQTALITRFAERLFPATNTVAQILRDSSLAWRPW